MTTTSVNDLSGVLDQVNSATDLLRKSKGQIPREVEEVVESLDRSLHADSPRGLDVDPYLLTALFAAALRSMKAIRHDNEDTRYRDLRLALEQLRHALRDIVDTAPFGDDEPIATVATRLAEIIQVPQSEAAAVLGVSTRQWQRWLAGEAQPVGDDAARVRIVAQIANQLRHSFTAPGVLRWFEREHPQLGEAPVQLLNDPLRYPELAALARGSRTTVG